MTVKQLIEELQKQDPEAPVLNDYGDVLDSVDSVDDAVSLCFVDADEDDSEDEDEE